MIYEASYLLFCIALAYINYRVIAADLRVYHALNGVAHLICWIVCYLLTKNIWLVLTLPFIGRLFFDTMLNLLRGLPVDYVPKNPKSIVDKTEKKVFGNNGILPKLIYLAIIIGLNFLI
jgi:hypothetical protein